MAEYGFNPVNAANPNLARAIHIAFNATGTKNLQEFSQFAINLADGLQKDAVAAKEVNTALTGMIGELGPAIQKFQGLNAVTMQAQESFAALSQAAFMQGTNLTTQLANLEKYVTATDAALKRMTAQQYYTATTGMGIPVGGIGGYDDKGRFSAPGWEQLGKQEQAAVKRELQEQVQGARTATQVIRDIAAHYGVTLQNVKQHETVTTAEHKIQQAEEREITKLKGQLAVEASKEVQELRLQVANVRESRVLQEKQQKLQSEINTEMGVLKAAYAQMGISLAKAGFQQHGSTWWWTGRGAVDQKTLGMLQGSLRDMQDPNLYAQGRTLGQNVQYATETRYGMNPAVRAQMQAYYTDTYGQPNAQGVLPGYNKQESASQHLFARTAVALTVLYSAQRVMSDTFRIARALETTTARIQAITGQVFPGQDFISNRYLFQRDSRQLARQYGRSPEEMAAAFETTFQAADMPSRQGVEITSVAAKMAQATGQSVETLTNILMGARNAFGLYGNDLLKFSDQLIKTWADGVLTFEEAERGLGKVFQVARNVGFTGVEGPNSLQAVMAMVAASTKMAGSPSQNMTMLSRFLTEMAKPQVVDKLATHGIGYDPTKPWDTFEGIMSAERSWRAEGKGSFIQGSGVFGRELARRGGAALYAQLPYIREQMTELGDASGYLEHAFAKTMDTSTARANRLVSAMTNIKTLVGDDLMHAFDAIVRPTNAWMDALERLKGVNPILATTSDALRVMVELSSSVLMSSMILRAGGTLLGVQSPIINAGGGAGGFFRGTMANIGMQGYGVWSALTGMGADLDTQHTFGTDINRVIAAQGVGKASQLRMQGSGFNPLLLGRIAWPLLALAGVDLVGKNLGQNMLEWSGEKQRDVEDSMFKYRGLVQFRREIGGAETFDEAKLLTNQFASQFDDLAEKYGISADQFITINGKVARSVDDLNEVLKGFTLADFSGEYIELMDKITIAAEAQEKAIKTDYNARSISRWVFGGIGGAFGELSNALTYAVEPDAALPMGATFEQAIGRTDYNQKLAEIADNKIKQEELIRKEQKRELIAADKNAEEAERVAKAREDAREAIRDTLDKYKAEAEALAKQSGIQSKIARHSEEQATATREIALREKIIETALKVMEDDVGDAAGVLAEILKEDDYAEFAGIFSEAIEQMAIMKESLIGINKALDGIEVYDKRIDSAFASWDIAAQQAAGWTQSYNDTMMALMGMQGGMFEGPTSELAKIVIGTTGSAVQSNTAIKQFGTNAERVDLAMQNIDRQALAAKVRMEGQIQSATTEGKPLSADEIQLMQDLYNVDWTGQGLQLKYRQEVERLFPAASGIQQGIMGQLGSIYQYAQWAKQYSGTDPKTGKPRGVPVDQREETERLLAMLKSQFGKDPVAFWKEFVGTAESSGVKDSLWQMDGGFQALDDFFGIIDTSYGGSLAQAINTDPAKMVKLLAELNTALEQSNSMNPGGDWLNNWLTINNKLDEMNLTVINDIIDNFGEVEKQSLNLATLLKEVSEKLANIDFAQIIQDAIDKVQGGNLGEELRRIDLERTARNKAIEDTTNEISDLSGQRADLQIALSERDRQGTVASDWRTAIEKFPVPDSFSTTDHHRADFKERRIKYMESLGYTDARQKVMSGEYDSIMLREMLPMDEQLAELDASIKALDEKLNRLTEATPYSAIADIAPIPGDQLSTGGLTIPGQPSGFIDALGLPPSSVLLGDTEQLSKLLDDPGLRNEIIAEAKDSVDQWCALTVQKMYELVYPWMKDMPEEARVSASKKAEWLLANAEKYGYSATRVDSVDQMQFGDYGVFYDNGKPVHGAISRGGNDWWSNQRQSGARGPGKSPFEYGVHLEPINQAASTNLQAANIEIGAASTMDAAANKMLAAAGGTPSSGNVAGAIRPPTGGKPGTGIVDTSTGLVIPPFPSDTAEYAYTDIAKPTYGSIKDDWFY